MDYCQSEYFNVSCPSVPVTTDEASTNKEGRVTRHEVLLIDSAHYGRMRQGRCITSTFGNLGCVQDVTWYIEKQCSGRSKCKIYIADPVLHRLNRCPKELSSYLEAKHRCISGKPTHICFYLQLHNRIIIEIRIIFPRKKRKVNLEIKLNSCT